MSGRCAEAPEARPAPEAPAVLVADVVRRDVSIYLESMGVTRGDMEIEVRARVEGFAAVDSLRRGPPGPQRRFVDSGFGRAGVAVARAQAEQAVVYRTTILIALREVADPLVALHQVRERIAQREGQVTSARETLRLSDARYVGGVADYLEVLDAQRVQFLAEPDLARSREDELVASVRLYRALGGGWSDDGLQRLIGNP